MSIAPNREPPYDEPSLYYITLQNKFVIRQIQICPAAKYIVHLKCIIAAPR